jgi:hypothetical protein
MADKRGQESSDAKQMIPPYPGADDNDVRTNDRKTDGGRDMLVDSISTERLLSILAGRGFIMQPVNSAPTLGPSIDSPTSPSPATLPMSRDAGTNTCECIPPKITPTIDDNDVDDRRFHRPSMSRSYPRSQTWNTQRSQARQDTRKQDDNKNRGPRPFNPVQLRSLSYNGLDYSDNDDDSEPEADSPSQGQSNTGPTVAAFSYNPKSSQGTVNIDLTAHDFEDEDTNDKKKPDLTNDFDGPPDEPSFHGRPLECNPDTVYNFVSIIKTLCHDNWSCNADEPQAVIFFGVHLGSTARDWSNNSIMTNSRDDDTFDLDIILSKFMRYFLDPKRAFDSSINMLAHTRPAGAALPDNASIKIQRTDPTHEPRVQDCLTVDVMITKHRAGMMADTGAGIDILADKFISA